MKVILEAYEPASFERGFEVSKPPMVGRLVANPIGLGRECLTTVELLSRRLFRYLQV